MRIKVLYQPLRMGWLTKTLRVMKMTAFILLVAVFQVSAHPGYSQGITLHLKQATIKEVLHQISIQTGADYVIANQDIIGARKIDIWVNDASLQEVLDLCFKDQPVNYKMEGTVIKITPKPAGRVQSVESPTMELPRVVKAQGIVFDEAGRPLAGANITIKETGHGTVTNVKGEYTISQVAINSTLIISFTGFTQQQVKVVDASPIQVFLSIAKNELDKVVVQAYGTTTARLNTGNISTVTAAEIERHPVANVLAALQGNVPGLVVQQTSGYASAPFKVEIRGRSQLDPTRPSEPLYIIDGVPLTVLESSSGGGSYESGSSGFLQNGMQGPAGGQSPIFSINPNDIESISVLKDGDATAIYGSRGANGVIIITTKSGKPGRASFDVNVYNGASNVTKHFSMMNTQQYLQMRHEAFSNDNITPNVANAYDLLKWDTSRYTDIQKTLWSGVGRATDAQAALSAGDKQNTFRLAGSYRTETDIMTVSGANQRTSLQSNISHRSLDQLLNISFTTNYSFTQIDIHTQPGYVTLPPDIPSIYALDGKLNWLGWSPQNNPDGVLYQPYSAKTSFLNSRLQIEYKLWKGLSLSTRLGYSTTHNSQTFIFPISTQNPLYKPKGSADFGNNNNSNAIVEPELNYKQQVWKGELNALVGGSYQSVTQTGANVQGFGYIDDNLLHSISNAPSKSAIDNNNQYKYVAGYARLNYNIANKYLLNLTARRDGSSRFGPGKQYGNFGAIGAAWIFSEEPWMKKDISFISFAKLRGSYGITGSDNIGDYGFLSAWSGSNINYFQGVTAYTTVALFNPDLEWQVNKKLEGAIDLGFLKDRILFTLAWYRDRCGNELINTPLPSQVGFTLVQTNLNANIQNTGIESTIKIKIADNSKVKWSFNFNIGINRNKLISFPGLEISPYANNYAIGKPLSIYRLLHYTGVDPQTGKYTFYDKNHDGKITVDPSDTANDLYEKDLSVGFDGGFGTDFTYKGFNLSLFFHFRHVYLPNIAQTTPTPGTLGNVPTYLIGSHWQKQGDNVNYARYTTQPDVSDINYQYRSDGIYQNITYLRLQNISLSYDLPGHLTKGIGLKSCRFFLHAENLLLFTNYKGLDPDTPQFGRMPPAKTYVGGIQISL